MIKKAFTLIELIFIIALIGIMASVASTYLRDDKLAMATYQVLEHIRYTQHLALSDHKFDPKESKFKVINGYSASNEGKYFRAWWQMRFQNVPSTEYSSAQIGYSVYSDLDREGRIDISSHKEAAANPIDGLRLDIYVSNKNTPDVNLFTKFNIANINLTGGCSVAGFTRINGEANLGTIAFDEKGRPYFGIADNAQNNPYEFLLTADCTIKLTGDGGRQSAITIHPETGYAEITRLD